MLFWLVFQAGNMLEMCESEGGAFGSWSRELTRACRRSFTQLTCDDVDDLNLGYLDDNEFITFTNDLDDSLVCETSLSIQNNSESKGNGHWPVKTVTKKNASPPPTFLDTLLQKINKKKQNKNAFDSNTNHPRKSIFP